MRSLLRSVRWMAPVGCILLACGPEPAPGTVKVVVAPPRLDIRISPDASALALGETLVLQAIVSGDQKPVLAWVNICESGSLALVVDPLGTSATITAERSGTCFVWVTLDGKLSARSWIRISPLPMGDGCARDSECAAEAPLCRVSVLGCGETCTRACDADADCPAPFKCVVGLHRCHALNDPDDLCP